MAYFVLLKVGIGDKAICRLDDLRIPPGNQLEAFKGSRSGQHSIRINDQWRLCFRWTDSGAEEVEIVTVERYMFKVTRQPFLRFYGQKRRYCPQIQGFIKKNHIKSVI
ncbi:MAG: type II toxin-antitoxin system RelE/ParE family toxin [Desulfobacterales bacterium]